MESKDSFLSSVKKVVIGSVMAPLLVLYIVPEALWFAYWGAKISLALTVAFGWHQFSATQIACALVSSRMFRAPVAQDNRPGWVNYLRAISMPVLLYLTVLAILWIAV